MLGDQPFGGVDIHVITDNALKLCFCVCICLPMNYSGE